MTTETMTVHKALAELKLLDDRIDKAIKKCVFCVSKKHSEKFVRGVPIDDVIKNIQSSYDTATDLIKRRKAIKKAVVLSNARTEIEIAGTKYTVAEAIEMKNHGVVFDKDLMNAMVHRLNVETTNADISNGEVLENRAEAYISSIYGNKETRKGMAAEAEEARQKFLEANRFEVIDPLHVQDIVSATEDSINAFMAEVDSALSCSNALTTITIEY